MLACNLLYTGAVRGKRMEKGEDVKRPGFGSFEVQERGERQGCNLHTGEAITIAASKATKFSQARSSRVP
jgi:DNA-binding protein HU-beta